MFLGVVVLIATLLALLLVVRATCERERLEAPEYFALMLFSATGMLLMASANDLIIVFLALEILSIPLYVLAAFDRRRLTSQEAGLKYFVLGVVLVGGLPLRHRARLRRDRHDDRSPASPTFLATTTLLDDGTLLAGLALLLVGLGFKVAAVPFHMWTPDVYQGAPTPVTAFMAVGHQGRRRSPRCCASSSARSRCTATTGARSSGRSPCSRCSSAASPRSSRPT